MRHRFHSICPYFAMFPETFAERWIEKLTTPGEAVLDPFCGRGTAPFQALLMNRRSIGNDVNPVAYVITRAKTNAPAASSVRRKITELERGYNAGEFEDQVEELPEFFRVAYAPSTLAQILYVRSRLLWRDRDIDCMLAAIFLGILHGESQKSPSYLSNQMPRTISTKPAYSIKFWKTRGLIAPERDAFALLRRQVDFRYASERPTRKATVIQGDMRELHLRALPADIKCVITSPPYLDVTNFEEDQWLRIWFLGGRAWPGKGHYSRDDRHESESAYWSLIGDMWRVLGRILAPGASVVTRIGAKKIDPARIVDGQLGVSVYANRPVSLVSSEVSELRGRQTRSFRPGSEGVLREVDCHFTLK